MTTSFWNNNHPMTPLIERLSLEFIPAAGKTEYVQSEVLRAAMRIHYDYYNNGFGNNMSQAIEYLDKYFFPLKPVEVANNFVDIREAALRPLGASISDDMFDDFMVAVLTHLQDAQNAGCLAPLTEEMFDMPYTETDFVEDEDEYEEDDQGDYIECNRCETPLNYCECNVDD